MPATPSTDSQGLRRAVRIVAILNFAYFFVEFGIGIAIGSVSLFADSIDFLEDAAINSLILMALHWSPRWRARAGFAMAGILLVPTLATIWAVWHKLEVSVPPVPLPMTFAGAGALVVNFGCALFLTRHRRHGGSLGRAAFLSARNDVLANIAILAAGGMTFLVPSIWPDIVVGVGIGIMNLGAAREVYAMASDEHRLSIVDSPP